ncbi:MAG: D-alanine--D-alanine ligase [Alphaproteobacteria bacterium]|nr:D-alanine--D-alanine ligase [Alphaproteobacteria bacterium]
MSTHVAVLQGGLSAEREVSLSSGKAVIEALKHSGYRVTPIDAGRDLAEALGRAKPDVVFNALHGRFGEDGCVQGVLELLRLPYTHSGLLASALAMEKPMAKRLFLEAGIPVPEGVVMARRDVTGNPPFDPPYVVKPTNEGSSVGVRIVRADDNRPPFDAENWPFGDTVLVERYVPGREIQVAVMGDRVLGAIEIRTPRGFYDYDAKYVPGLSEHLMPAPIHPKAYDEACRLAMAAHSTLGCRGVSRTDMRYDDTQGEPGRLVVLEINTQPGMTPTSLVPEIARHRGISFEQLVVWMVENARCGD